MRRVCIYHAGCPDGFGAAWAAWRAWGEEADYVARGHDDALRPASFEDALVVFVDIAPPAPVAQPLADAVGHLVVLDHHLSSKGHYDDEPGLVNGLRSSGHEIVFDLEHSGAVLSWHHFHPEEEPPELLAYVQDMDLWNWKLPQSREVNAAIGSYPRNFETWEMLAKRPIAELAAEGSSLVRAQQIEVERSLHSAHPVSLGTLRVEAVNAREQRSLIGHELASRARFGSPCGAVYRLTSTRVDVSVYSIGDFDVAAVAGKFGGGGHRNAAGFSVTIEEWLAKFV
ncbi:MAG: hypothetical protein JRH01_01415 [Deltaproteobacteria bacterium]|nr:hypothetical protein [Deltaproteobacteria bacterium]MBW2394187.1 hypothetical protein [Deltaproteobacteria bacterium]